jgi:hypothetical protein
VQFVGRRATNLGQGNGKKYLAFYDDFTLLPENPNFSTYIRIE